MQKDMNCQDSVEYTKVVWQTEELKDIWQICFNATLLFISSTAFLSKQSKNPAVCIGCCELTLLFLLDCKLSWAQDDFVIAKVFLTEEF